MSFAEIESDLDGFQDQSFASDDYGAFDEEDFAAMGINPTCPTVAKPGSEDKVQMLAARYAAGLQLWNEEDRYDHGPDEAALESSGFDDDDD